MAAIAPGHDTGRPGGRDALYGPAIDGLLGFGGLYGIAFVAFWLYGESLRAVHPLWLFPLLIVLVSGPHYGATLLRVYERREDREAHRFVAFYVTGALLLAFVVGVYSLPVASLLTTAYLTWSPWHFSAQNYGIALMALGRRGLPLDPGSRRLFRIAFVASFALVALVLHGPAGPQDYGQGGQVETVRFLSLGLPQLIVGVAVPILLVVQATCVAVVLFRLLRRGAGRRVLPVVGLVGIQGLWFTLPFTLGHYGTRTGVEPLDYELRYVYFAWISIAHAIQYLWVTTYYARRSPGWPGGGRYMLKAVLAGQAIAVIPLVLFSPDTIGNASWRAGLFMLIASTLNLHHFILDGAIWKLRSQRVSRVLVQDGRDDAGPLTARRPWLRRVLWGAAAAATVVGLLNLGNRWVRVEPQIRTGDLAGAQRSLDQLAWFGADDEMLRVRLGKVALRAGEPAVALANFERSLELTETPDGWVGVAEAQMQRGATRRSYAALTRALELRPDDAGVLLRAGMLGRKLGKLDASRAYLQRAVALDPDNDQARQALAEVDAVISRRRAG